MSSGNQITLDALLESVNGLTGLFEALIEQEIVASDSAVVQAADAATSAAAAASTAASISSLVATAAASAQTATNDASASLTEAIAAQTSATQAAASATTASSAAASAMALYTAWTNVFLGELPADPTTNNQGGALINGAMYLNITDSPPVMRIYVAGVWEDQDASSGTSTQAAQTSAAQAANSASNAATSATNAASSATAAAASDTDATTQAANAATSATTATSAATTATTQAAGASASAGNAAASAAAAASSATSVGTQASTATTAASSASTSATNAGNSATAAAGSAATAGTAVTNAGTAASNAAASATAASASAATATTQAGNAATSATAAAGSVSTAATQAGAATASATTATNAATTATTEAGTAGVSATAAATSATAAATQAGNAATSATTAAGSATAAATSASAAATNAATVHASMVAFGALWLGAHATPPTVDSNGNAVQVGAEYEDTSQTPPMLMVYGAGGWVAQDGSAVTASSNAQLSATSASGSAGAAASSAAAANTSATNAAASATAAASSATTASTQATAATGSASTASTQATAASGSAGAANISATNAANSATAAAGSATTAATQATAAGTAANLAEAWAAQPSGVVGGTTSYSAAYYAQQSSASAAAAGSSAVAASNSASTATTQATGASTSAGAAATSATNAAGSATTASTQAGSATTSASAASGSASTASTAATNAGNSATTAATQAGLASTSATAAGTSATNAATSATAAAASATTASAAAATATAVQTNLNGIYDLNTTGGSVTLTATQFSNGIIWVQGALASNLIITVPATSHPFIVDNATTNGYSVTVKMAGGTAQTPVAQGNANQLFCDGSTGVYSVSSVSGLQFNSVKAISGATNALTNLYQGAYTPMSNGGGTTYAVTLPQGSTMGVGGAIFVDALSGLWSIAPYSGDTADFGAVFGMGINDKTMFTWNGASWRTTLYSNQASPAFKTSLSVPVAYITGRAVLAGVADDGVTSLQATTGRFTTSLTVPTMAAGDNSFNAANTAYVYAAINALIGGAPGNLDTLNELAAAINDETNFASAMTNLLAAKANISGQTFTGPIAATTVGATTSMQSYGYGGNNATGMLYLGNSGNTYLYYDGTNYNMPGGNLVVNGQQVWTAGNLTPANYALLNSSPIFTGQVTGTNSNGALRATNTGTNQTSIWLNQSGAATDQKTWEIIASGSSGSFGIRAINDAYTASLYAMQVTRGSGYTLGTMALMANGGRVLVGGVYDDGVTELQVVTALSVQRVSATSQAINLNAGTTNSLISYSPTSASVPLVLNSTTDFANDAVTAGSLGLLFQVLGATKAQINQAGRFLLGAATDDGTNLLQVAGGLHLSSGPGITFPDGTTQSTAYAVTAPTALTYTPGAGTTTFSVQNYGLGLIQVFEGGGYLVPGQDYTALTGNSVTLTVAANGRNSFTVLTGTLFNASNVIQPNVAVVTGTVGSTALAIPISTLVGYLWLYQGGAWLQPGTDFTFNGGTAVTLLNAPTATTDTFTAIMLQPISFASAATQANVQAAQLTFALDTGVANAYAVNYIPAVGTPTQGMQLSFFVLHANSGASTLTCNGGVAYPIYGNGHSPLSGTEFVVGSFVEVAFSSTLGAWILLENTGGAQQNAGNLNFVGLGNRITGDMSNANYSNQVAFQSSTVNGITSVNAYPNGTGITAQFGAFGNSNPTNASYVVCGVSEGVSTFLNSGFLGSGSYLPMTFGAGGTERMRIPVSGTYSTLLIGQTGYQSAVCGLAVKYQGAGLQFGLVLWATGDTTTNTVFLNAAGNAVGTITQTASAVSFNTTSDYRLKENIAPLKGALQRVMNAKVVTYNFKDDPAAEEYDGFLAHELAEIVPRAVVGEKDAVRYEPVFRDGHDPKNIRHQDVLEVQEHIEPQMVDHAKAVPLLMAAIQELTLEVRTLRAEIQHLKKGK